MENRNTRSKKPQAAAVLGYVIAKKDFLQSKEPGALLFEKGEILQVILEYSQKWWKARNSQGEEGYIPVSRVTQIDYPDSRTTTWGAHQHTFEPEPDYTNQVTDHNTAETDVKLTRDSLLDINNRKEILEDNRLPSPNKQDSLKNSGGVAYTSQQTADASFEWNQRRASSQEKITNTESTRSRLYPSPYIASDTSAQRDHRPSDKDSVEKLQCNRQATQRSKESPVQISSPKRKHSAKGSTPTKSRFNLLYILLGLIVAVIAVCVGLYFYYGNQNTFSQIESSPHSVSQFQIDASIQSLKENFNGQPDMTFRIVKAAIRRLNEANPKEPGIVALVAVKGSEDISRRFSRQLAEAASPFKDVVTISGQDFSEKDPDVAKKSIDDLLINNLKENELGSVFVDRLDYVPDEAALIFHTYCDHENAPYKRVLYIFSVVVEEIKSSDPKDWDRILQEHLYKEWDKLGVDQISSLMSRLSVRVAAIVPKDEVSDN